MRRDRLTSKRNSFSVAVWIVRS